MGETQTSVKNVIPDVGNRFNLDENVVSGEQTSASRSTVL